MLSRRTLLGAGVLSAATALSGCSRLVLGDRQDSAPGFASPNRPPADFSSGSTAYYGALTDGGFNIPAVPDNIVEARFKRQVVPNTTGEPAGTVVVDPNTFYLYLVQNDGTAMRYGIGVGREGFAWSGASKVQYKRRWPTWKPPDEMVARQPELEKYSIANGGMEGGPENPLGARALYLFQATPGGVWEDTLYRIHGNPDARSIGRAVSSGCIRMLNQDVIDLHDRVPNGARVVVRSAQAPASYS
ncbi:L,D-transpeptidase [Rhizobiaceae bacterium]|nr:L,D-transpeptidase [Rhizobiaceae bacterium]